MPHDPMGSIWGLQLLDLHRSKLDIDRIEDLFQAKWLRASSAPTVHSSHFPSRKQRQIRDTAIPVLPSSVYCMCEVLGKQKFQIQIIVSWR
jgi:hypothetical protein